MESAVCFTRNAFKDKYTPVFINEAKSAIISALNDTLPIVGPVIIARPINVKGKATMLNLLKRSLKIYFAKNTAHIELVWKIKLTLPGLPIVKAQK